MTISKISLKAIYFILPVFFVSGCKKDQLIADPFADKVSLSHRISSLAPPTAFDVEQKVRFIIRHQLGIEDSQIQNGSNLTTDLDADIIDLIEIRNQINEEFQINLSWAQTEALLTVGQWITAVQNAVKPESISSEHQETITVPYATSPQIVVTFKCQIERKGSTQEITKVADIKATAVAVTNTINNGNTIVQTVKTSYSSKTGSNWLNFTSGGETKVTWNGEVTVEVTTAGITSKYKTILSHSAIVGVSAVNVTENSFSTLELQNPTTPTDPGTPPQWPNTFHGRMQRVIYEKFNVSPALIVDSANIRTDFGGDDLDQIEFISDIEDEFNITIYDEDLEKIVSVRNLYDFILAHAN